MYSTNPYTGILTPVQLSLRLNSMYVRTGITLPESYNLSASADNQITFLFLFIKKKD